MQVHHLSNLAGRAKLRSQELPRPKSLSKKPMKEGLVTGHDLNSASSNFAGAPFESEVFHA
jgi:hypothetical protein